MLFRIIDVDIDIVVVVSSRRQAKKFPNNSDALTTKRLAERLCVSACGVRACGSCVKCWQLSNTQKLNGEELKHCLHICRWWTNYAAYDRCAVVWVTGDTFSEVVCCQSLRGGIKPHISICRLCEYFNEFGPVSGNMMQPQLLLLWHFALWLYLFFGFVVKLRHRHCWCVTVASIVIIVASDFQLFMIF